MKKDWEQLEELILAYVKELDHYAKRCPGSGNKGRKGDIVTSINLGIEIKDRNTKSPYDEKWLSKCAEEIPLHSQKIPIVVTRNSEGKIRVHLDWSDFWEIYKKSIFR